MHVHFIAVAGTGMGSLAGLFKAAGHRVSGSDSDFYPPMGPALEAWGIELMRGHGAHNLEPPPDLVVIGNVCRSNHPEARAAIDGGLLYTHMCAALTEHILPGTSPLVVAGTHGKTTTSSMCACLLEHAGTPTGFLIGGIPKNFDRGWQLPPNLPGKRQLPIAKRGRTNPRQTPFVIEGDEYDTAFFEKTPKCWHYRPEVAIVTSIEHDHIDIYPDEASYHAAFAGFIARVPESGLIIAHAADPAVAHLVKEHAKAPVAWYAIEGDPLHAEPPHWLAAPAENASDGQSFDVYAGGMLGGRARLKASGRHNVRNALAALAAVSQGYGVPLSTALKGLEQFDGVARRQDLIAEINGVRIYDDFAHHPTAVRETLDGLRKRHPQGTLWAVYEPRTATACRGLHQDDYCRAFDGADRIIMAPLGRSTVPEHERLDLDSLIDALAKRGQQAENADSIDSIVRQLTEQARPGDTIALLSNGSFGDIYTKLTTAMRA